MHLYFDIHEVYKFTVKSQTHCVFNKTIYEYLYTPGKVRQQQQETNLIKLNTHGNETLTNNNVN